MAERPIVFTGASLIRGGALIPDAFVVVRGENIEETGQGPLPEKYSGFERTELDGAYLSPGFIDPHCHGGGNADFMDGTLDAILTAARTHMRFGTTTIAPTTLTCPDDELFEFFGLYEEAKKVKENMPDLMGIHLEGPVIARSQAGAQPQEFIREPSAEYAEKVISEGHGNVIRWSMAPELPGALSMADRLSELGVMLSIAHTEADYDDVAAAAKHGFLHMTHFYSTMTAMHRVNARRVLGAVEAGYMLDDMNVEIIADGIHLPPEILKYVLKFKSHDKITLITDSMRGAAMPEGESWLGDKKHGIPVVIEDGVAKLPDRSAYAGSVATSDRLVRVMVREAGLSVPEAVMMITKNTAKLYGISDRVGSIEKGKRADLVVFDKDIKISRVYVRGKKVV